ncbi:hypothetical protein PVK06_005197 [Gossypium arboreum]|uniref:Uncharacterized protein n=1 Tax=Gossypium arboreum TaxID=29729 RepID=A0ABR0QTZ8_GOSAR|nr:hypothetical protein PVK06_005197 [Gossypium arboreum]
MTSLMNAHQKPDTPIKDHMITLMGYFKEVANNKANLDQNTQIEIVFKSPSKDIASFRASYNLGNKNLGLTQLMKELQSYELMLNSGQPIRRVEANIDVPSSKGKGKCAKKGKAKVSRPPQVEMKRTKKPKYLSKSKCFFYNKK